MVKVSPSFTKFHPSPFAYVAYKIRAFTVLSPFANDESFTKFHRLHPSPTAFAAS
jgi:hypothetical protein